MTEPLPAGAVATLEALLAGADPAISALRAQIPHARVTGGCACGCATLDLTVDRTAVAPAPAAGGVVADAWYQVPENAGVMLFAREGYLSLLEIYTTSSAPITTWPEPRFQQR
ncbi:hypothetical protein ACSNOH_16395 [Streptomyces sp. URMC 127]|uniref:hypothetical protein n=1 Tax=Streptomyces sp. URMC 127 TaxID=3423402 RepID=UPI003F1C494C